MESLASLCISQLLGLPGARVPHPHPIMPSHPSDHAPLKPTGEDSLGRQAMGGRAADTGSPCTLSATHGLLIRSPRGPHYSHFRLGVVQG